jgi:8-oxo-dGTP pyrophosphatase MutT (NUDIX family)
MHFTEKDDTENIIVQDDVEKFWKDAFVPAFHFIEAAGGVVVKNRKILVIFRNEKWDLPKGKIHKDETPEKAALREVHEECGINGHSIILQLSPTFHIYKSPYKDNYGQWILKKTYWFEMHYSGSEKGRPQTEENITEVKWFSKSELDLVLLNTYENIKTVFLSYLD